MKIRKNRSKPFHLTLVLTLVVTAAIILLSFLFLSVEKVTSEAMSPTLKTGDIVIALKQKEIKRDDIVAFYYSNKILVRRCIGTQGDWIDIDENGTVSLNSQVLDEPYVLQASLGDGDVQYPYQVTKDRYFVMGDNRDIAVDSRTSVVGCISKEQSVGKVVLRIWPLNRITKF